MQRIIYTNYDEWFKDIHAQPVVLCDDSRNEYVGYATTDLEKCFMIHMDNYWQAWRRIVGSKGNFRDVRHPLMNLPVPEPIEY